MSLQSNWCFLCSSVLWTITWHRINLFGVIFYPLPCKASSHPQDPQDHPSTIILWAAIANAAAGKPLLGKEDTVSSKSLWMLCQAVTTFWRFWEIYCLMRRSGLYGRNVLWSRFLLSGTQQNQMWRKKFKRSSDTQRKEKEKDCAYVLYRTSKRTMEQCECRQFTTLLFLLNFWNCSWKFWETARGDSKGWICVIDIIIQAHVIVRCQSVKWKKSAKVNKTTL